MNHSINKLLDTLNRPNLANQGLRSYSRIPEPWLVVHAVHQRASDRCEDCGEDSGKLALHHFTHRTIDDEPIFGRETPDDLQLLCRPCHKEKHLDPDGYFQPDPELNSISKL